VLLKGTAAEGAVPLLLAARDAHLKADVAYAAAAQEEVAAGGGAAAAGGTEPAPVERPTCAICMEAYSAAAGVVPRVLISCGHIFCEACLDRMLRCVRRP
jgi:hypothetical protein